MNPTLRKVLIWVGGIAAVLGLLMFGFFNYTKSHSPEAVASSDVNGLSVSVSYCQPSVKGRVVFGTEGEDALQPYGAYWRVGANEATEIEFGQDVVFAGANIKAGRYVLYAVPGETEWTIGLNSELKRWGVPEVDHSLDVVQVKTTAQQMPSVTEMMTISFEPEGAGIVMYIDWAKTRVPVQITSA